MKSQNNFDTPSLNITGGFSDQILWNNYNANWIKKYREMETYKNKIEKFSLETVISRTYLEDWTSDEKLIGKFSHL